MQLCGTLTILWHCLSLGLEWQPDLFQSCGHCWIFQISWHIECSTFTASSFRIWSSSTGIPSPPLTLLVVMLPKAHLTLHSRISGSRWVIIPPWLSGLWRSFLYSSSVYSCHLFLMSSGSVRSIPFLSFIVPRNPLKIISNYNQNFSSGSAGKESACSVGDTGNVGLIPGSGRSSGEGSGNPLQYSCWVNPMDRGTWWAIVHGVTSQNDLMTKQ